MKVGDLIRIWPLCNREGQVMSEEDVKIALVYHIEEGQTTKAPTTTTLKILIGSRKARIWQSWKSSKTTWIMQDPDSSTSVKMVQVENLGNPTTETQPIPLLEK